MSHTSYIELNHQNLKRNIAYLKEYLNDNCRYSMVIKGNAYGHGIESMVPLAQQCGIDHFSVFSSEEAKKAFKHLAPNTELMIMGFIEGDDIEWAIQNGISFYIFTKSRLNKTIAIAKKLNQKAKVHIELETGMNRTGFNKSELKEIIPILKSAQQFLSIDGICTHLAGAESMSNHERVSNQIKLFHNYTQWLEEEEITARYKHIACSAGALNYPETELDLVRFGISTYGYWPTKEVRQQKMLLEDNFKDPLRAVLSWQSSVMSLKQVKEGEYISYGKSYLTNRDSLIASVPVGYAYGFSRDLSNLGRVLINKHRVPVIGVVNMNMMLVDVTDLKSVKEGDRVTLIGKQGELQVSVSSFSDMSNSLNYELLSRLPADIPRKIV